MTESEARELAQKILGWSDADDTFVQLKEGRASSTRFANNVITQNVASRTFQVTIRASVGRKTGEASTNLLTDDSLREAVGRAVQIARFSPEDPEWVPAIDPQNYPDVPGFYPRTESLSPMEKAQQLSRVLHRRENGIQMAGSYYTGADTIAAANSRGLFGFYRGSLAVFRDTAMRQNNSYWVERIDPDVKKVDVEGSAALAAEKVRAAEDPIDLEPGEYPVVLEPAALGEMLEFVLSALEAKGVEEGRSFFSGKLGEQVAGPNVTIYSDPADPVCPSCPISEDGLAAPKATWIENGVVKRLVTSRWWGAQHNTQPTGWPGNLLMKGGDTPAEEMVRSMKKGLLVTRFWYIRHVDPKNLLLTGMTRDGLFLVENGEITRAVRHFRFNESPVDILNRIETMSAPLRTGEYMPTRIPTALVSSFRFTSKTEF